MSNLGYAGRYFGRDMIGPWEIEQVIHGMERGEETGDVDLDDAFLQHYVGTHYCCKITDYLLTAHAFLTPHVGLFEQGEDTMMRYADVLQKNLPTGWFFFQKNLHFGTMDTTFRESVLHVDAVPDIGLTLCMMVVAKCLRNEWMYQHPFWARTLTQVGSLHLAVASDPEERMIKVDELMDIPMELVGTASFLEIGSLLTV